MRSAALNQARLEWVTRNLKLAHYIYTLADQGDIDAIPLRKHLWDNGHLRETQVHFAKRIIRKAIPGADLDETNTVINERAVALFGWDA